MDGRQGSSGRDGAGPGLSKMSAPPSGRYVTLDGLRGIAAIAVALYHYDRAIMPHGYLAVDFFFVLSGFVLIEAYRERFEKGLGAMRFMALRFFRLYPLYLLGSAIAVVRVGQIYWRHGLEALSLPQFLASLPVNLLLLPSPFTSELFPINVPSWSLFLELVANLGLALVVLQCTRVRLILWVVLTGAALVVAGLHLSAAGGGVPADFASDPFSAGWAWQGLEVGLLRSAYSFAMGMLISELLRARARRYSRLSLLAWATIIVALGFNVTGSAGFWFACSLILVGSPLLVAAASRFEPPASWRGPAMWLGDVSFALYAIHAPLSGLFQRTASLLGITEGVMAAVYLVVTLALATMAHRWFDVPVRQALARRFLAK